MLLPTQTCVAVSFISSVWTKPLMSCTLLPVSAAGWFVSAVFLQPHTDSQVINLKQNREDFYVFRGVNLFRVQRAVCFHWQGFHGFYCLLPLMYFLSEESRPVQLVSKLSAVNTFLLVNSHKEWTWSDWCVWCVHDYIPTPVVLQLTFNSSI